MLPPECPSVAGVTDAQADHHHTLFPQASSDPAQVSGEIHHLSSLKASSPAVLSRVMHPFVYLPDD